MPPSTSSFPPRSPAKRATDIALALLVLPILAFLTLVMTLVMQLVSPGPVFFLQERIGYRGRRFMLYKFRTMHVGADTRGHQAYCEQLIGSRAPMVKLDRAGDSRVIPGGRWLRAAGLDELPQLINVLRGEMSLIGPRPCLPFEFERYEAWQRERFAAVPGLSGLWQVSGKNHTTFDEMVRLDIQYAEKQSWWLDLKIMFLTPLTLWTQIRELKPRQPDPSPPFRSGASVDSIGAPINRMKTAGSRVE